MKKSEVKQYLLKYYKGLLSIDEGLNLIRHYCLDFGTKEHKKQINTFILLLSERPELFTYCLKYAIEEFEIKFSVVKIIAKPDPYALNTLDKIITIY